MKTKKLLKAVTLISILLFSSMCFAITAGEFIEIHQDRIIEQCEAEDEKFAPMRNSPIGAFMRFPNIYECILPQFYAIRKNVDHQLNTEDPDDWKKFTEIMEANYNEVYDTWDFVAVNLEFEAYLENGQ